MPDVGNEANFQLLGAVPNHRARKSSALTLSHLISSCHRGHSRCRCHNHCRRRIRRHPRHQHFASSKREPLPPPYSPAPTATTFRLIQEGGCTCQGVTGAVYTPLGRLPMGSWRILEDATVGSAGQARRTNGGHDQCRSSLAPQDGGRRLWQHRKHGPSCAASIGWGCFPSRYDKPRGRRPARHTV